MREIIMMNNAKLHEDRLYRYWNLLSKKELIESIKIYKSTRLHTVQEQYDCYYKRKWLKRSYKEKFVKNIFDRIYLRWI